jgi:hypothetical protein
MSLDLEAVVSDGKRAYANWSALDLCEYMEALDAYHESLENQSEESTWINIEEYHEWLDKRAAAAIEEMDKDKEYQAQFTQ